MLHVYQPKKIHPGGIYKTGMKSAPEKGRKHTNGQTGFRDWKQLPVYVLQDILNRLEDVRVLANAQLVCRDFGDAGNQVRSLRLTVLESQHARARNRNVFDLGSLKSGISDGAESSSSRDERSKLKMKDQLVKILKTKLCIEQLRIEVEPKLQAKIVTEHEKRRTDFWLSDPLFVKKWLPMQSTLEHVCLVDYGQQAIMRRSDVIRVFSNSCKLYLLDPLWFPPLMTPKLDPLRSNSLLLMYLLPVFKYMTPLRAIICLEGQSA